MGVTGPFKSLFYKVELSGKIDVSGPIKTFSPMKWNCLAKLEIPVAGPMKPFSYEVDIFDSVTGPMIHLFYEVE